MKYSSNVRCQQHMAVNFLNPLQKKMTKGKENGIKAVTFSKTDFPNLRMLQSSQSPWGRKTP